MTDRIYYVDTDLREFEARIVGLGESIDGPWVVLDRSAFYPNSGGQPHDTGQIANVRVVSVDDVTGTMRHTLAGGQLEIGQVVVGRIDDARRRDHTQQHSAQHILSAAFERLGGPRTVSFHLGAVASTIDLDQSGVGDRLITDAEHLAQEVVLENRQVFVHFAEPGNLDQATLRKPTERQGSVRIIEIADFDRSACGGTHVSQTGQIGLIKIRHTERRGSTTRIEFVAGWRAVSDYSDRLASTRSIAEQLSVKDTQVDGAVRKLVSDLRTLRAEVFDARQSLLEHEARALIAEAADFVIDGKVKLVRKCYVDKPIDELKYLALRIAERDSTVVLLGSTGLAISLVFAQAEGLPFDVQAILRYVVGLFGGRGGGSRNLAQGGGPASGSVETLIGAAEERLRTDCAKPANLP